MAYVRLFTSNSSECTNTITIYVKDRTGAAQPRPISTDISCREGGSATRNGWSVLPWVDNRLRRKFHDRFHGWNHASSSPAIHEFSWIKNRSYCNLRWKFCYVDYIKLLNSIFFSNGLLRVPPSCSQIAVSYPWNCITCLPCGSLLEIVGLWHPWSRRTDKTRIDGSIYRKASAIFEEQLVTSIKASLNQLMLREENRMLVLN